MNYCPNVWVAVRIHDSKTDSSIYKIYGGWLGGFAKGDSWRLNSGISSIVDYKDHWLVYGHSGSAYTCYKNLEGLQKMTHYLRSVLENVMIKAPEHMEISIVPITEVKTNES